MVGLDLSVGAEDFSSVYIYGGEFKAGVVAWGNSHYYIYGGQFGENSGVGLEAGDSSIVDIFGYDFSSGYIDWGGGDIVYYLSGKWEDGTPFTFNYGFYEPSTDDHINLHVVPEPCSMVLLSLGGLMLRRRYRR